MSSLCSRNKTLVLAAKNYAEDVITVFCSCPILLDFLTLFQMFCPWLYKVPLLEKRHLFVTRHTPNDSQTQFNWPKLDYIEATEGETLQKGYKTIPNISILRVFICYDLLLFSRVLQLNLIRNLKNLKLFRTFFHIRNKIWLIIWVYPVFDVFWRKLSLLKAQVSS